MALLGQIFSVADVTGITVDRPAQVGRIVVGMSGGVDSSVAAMRLRDTGHEVHGLFMVNWTEDEQGYCTAADDYRDAQRVADRLGIPLHKADFSADYRREVFAHFLAEYAAGRTPNPDVLCNRAIKFGVFLDYARRLGATHIATGHYARAIRAGGRVRLLKGVDTNKDQSYFLNAIEPTALAATLFPLGELTKPQVRDAAGRAGLPTAGKKDSTGICFVGERDFREFLGHYLPNRPGPIETPDGTVVGKHRGLFFYTPGQRQGLGLGGRAGAADAPWYVLGKDPDGNRLIVGQGHDHPALFARALSTGPVNWLADRPAPGTVLRVHAKTRYRQADQACTVTVHAERCEVAFDRPQRAVVPGQSAVFYRGDECLGGGVIETVEPADTAHALTRRPTASKVK